MTTLVDLMQTEVPTEVELVGKRLSGTLPVQFYRGARLQPVIRFGADMYSKAEGRRVVCNGIECDIAGITFWRRPDGEWEVARNSYGSIRRASWANSGGDMYVSHKTHTAIFDACKALCPSLYERFEHAFQPLGARSEYADPQSYTKWIAKLEHDISVIRQFEELTAGIAEGRYVVVSGRPEFIDDDRPDIRWETPDCEEFRRHDIHRSRGPVIGKVIDVEHGGQLVGFVVDRGSSSHYDPDCYHAPLLIPVDLASHA